MCLDGYREIEPEEQEFYKVMWKSCQESCLTGLWHEREYEIGVKYTAEKLSTWEASSMLTLDYPAGFHGYVLRTHAIRALHEGGGHVIVRCKGTVRGLGDDLPSPPPLPCVVASDMTILEIIEED